MEKRPLNERRFPPREALVATEFGEFSMSSGRSEERAK
jgi:hypothetical protein